MCEHLFGYTGNKRELEMSERSYHLNGGCCGSDHCNIHDPDNYTATPDPNTVRPTRPPGKRITIKTIKRNVCLIVGFLFNSKIPIPTLISFANNNGHNTFPCRTPKAFLSQPDHRYN